MPSLSLLLCEIILLLIVEASVIIRFLLAAKNSLTDTVTIIVHVFTIQRSCKVEGYLDARTL